MTDEKKKDPFNGIYLEISSDGLGELQVGGGIEFTDDVGTEYTQVMENLLLGIVSSLSNSFPRLIELGETLQRNPNFKWEDYGIQYEGVTNSSTTNIVDINDFFKDFDSKNIGNTDDNYCTFTPIRSRRYPFQKIRK